VTVEINIDLEKLAAIALLASRTDVRQQLNGVYVEASGAETRIAATDGIQCGMLRHAEPADMSNVLGGQPQLSVILPMDVIDKMKPSKHLANVATIIGVRERDDGSIDGWRVRLIDGTLIPFKVPEGRYPNLSRLLPLEIVRDVPTPRLDVSRLATFMKVHKALGVKNCGNMLIDGSDGSPAIIRFPARPDFVGVLSPMQWDEDKSPALARWS